MTLRAAIRRAAVGICAAGVIGACGSYTPPPAVTTSAGTTTEVAGSPSAAAAATNDLAAGILARLPVRTDAVISPYSIEQALAMLEQGAGGATLAQLEKLLDGASPAVIASSNGQLAGDVARASTTYPKRGHPQFDDAASVWIDKRLKLKPAFESALTTQFGAVPAQVSFGEPEVVARNIDSWVAAHTASRIRSLLAPGSVSSSDKLVLVSAGYLHATWRYPFDKSLTAPHAFTTAGGSAVQVQMMQMGSAQRLGFAKTGGYEAVELPYRDSRLAMLAVMPSRRKNVTGATRPLGDAGLERLLGRLRQRREIVAMPRIKLSFKADLTAVLTQLGIGDVFSPAADFSGMTAASGVRVNSLQHAAVMDVDERGTVAAAATAVGVAPTVRSRRSAATITFDRPYFLFLVDTTTGASLFAARVADPS